MTHKYGWGSEVQGGTAGQLSDIYYSYTGNQRNGFGYDPSGNLTNDLGQTFTYDATGQQATASYGGYSLQQSYDGDGLRVKKNDNGATTYYLRSSLLGGQVVAEIQLATTGGGSLSREYVYLGGQLLALRSPTKGSLKTYWVHEDPITKSKRVTNSLGGVVSTIETDPWGADTARSNNAAFQPKKFTSYERDGNGSDEAMFRRYNRWHSRFDQPDPYDGSYSLTDPQSFNRYAYTQNDPVNFVDPSGLLRYLCMPTQPFGDGLWVYTCEPWPTFGGALEFKPGGGGLGPGVTPPPPDDDPCDTSKHAEEVKEGLKQIAREESTRGQACDFAIRSCRQSSRIDLGTISGVLSSCQHLVTDLNLFRIRPTVNPHIDRLC